MAALETKINNCNTDEQLRAEIEDYDNLKIELQRIYLMKEIESFYENLHASYDKDSNEAFNDFVRDLQTDKLTHEERENLERVT